MSRTFFQDKVVIVTGGSAGIGKQLASQLLGYGAQVVITGRNQGKLESATRELSAISDLVIPYTGDVSDFESCLALASFTIERFGQIDILINNAGMAQTGKVEELQHSVVSNLIDINLKGPIYTSMACIPHLKDTKGSIVFVSSVAGLIGLPEHGIYSSSKMALRSIVETLKFELGKDVFVGISYVGFTKNDPDKVMYNPDGTLIEIPKRPGGLSFTQEKTASLILKQITRKKFISNPSILGKVLNSLISVSPRFTHWVMRQVNKRRG